METADYAFSNANWIQEAQPSVFKNCLLDNEETCHVAKGKKDLISIKAMDGQNKVAENYTFRTTKCELVFWKGSTTTRHASDFRKDIFWEAI